MKKWMIMLLAIWLCTSSAEGYAKTVSKDIGDQIHIEAEVDTPDMEKEYATYMVEVLDICDLSDETLIKMGDEIFADTQAPRELRDHRILEGWSGMVWVFNENGEYFSGGEGAGDYCNPSLSEEKYKGIFEQMRLGRQINETFGVSLEDRNEELSYMSREEAAEAVTKMAATLFPAGRVTPVVTMVESLRGEQMNMMRDAYAQGYDPKAYGEWTMQGQDWSEHEGVYICWGGYSLDGVSIFGSDPREMQYTLPIQYGNYYVPAHRLEGHVCPEGIAWLFMDTVGTGETIQKGKIISYEEAEAAFAKAMDAIIVPTELTVRKIGLRYINVPTASGDGQELRLCWCFYADAGERPFVVYAFDAFTGEEVR